MTKISVSIPDDLAAELRDQAADNVSRFVATAVRDALDRRRLARALAHLDAELGQLDVDDVAEADAEFARVEAANLAPAEPVAPKAERAKRIADQRPAATRSGSRKG